MDANKFDQLINDVIRQLLDEGLINQNSQTGRPNSSEKHPEQTHQAVDQLANNKSDFNIDLPDITTEQFRKTPQVQQPFDAEALSALMETTNARLGVGRAGVRPKIESLLIFQSDFAVSQDALYKEVDQNLLDRLGLFSVNTSISGGKAEYLLRPDLGRSLSDEAKVSINQRCVKQPDVQICVGDGLSASAIEANTEKIYPVLISGCQNNGLKVGTSFFIKNCRVGVMNDIGDLIQPEVLILLIGERPGLGRSDSMSAYMAYRPRSGQTDADREVICNIFDNGGTNPLEAGAYAIQQAQEMIRKKGSGVKQKLTL